MNVPLQNKIKALEEEYLEKCDKLAIEQFHIYIEPFCLQWKYDFWAGMGDYGFGYKQGDRWIIIDHDDLPKKLQDILEETIITGQNLGSLMPDINHPNNHKGEQNE